MTFVLGLTGSIGMGKSTTARLFADEGVPVWDADQCVHDLYAVGGAATKVMAKRFPSVLEHGKVSRAQLRALIGENPEILNEINGMIHPLVAADRKNFVSQTDAPIILLDIPLLFEVGADGNCDGVAVVSVPGDVQRERVLERGEMSEAEFEMILSRQMPDAEKRARARWVIITDTIEHAKVQVRAILKEIREGQMHA